MRKLFEFGAYRNSLNHLDWSHGVLAVFYNQMFNSQSKFITLSMKVVVRTCACAASLDHLDLTLLMFGSHGSLNSGWIPCLFYFETDIHLPIFQGSCSHFELMQIHLIIWIAVMVDWQYFVIIFIQETKFSPTNEDSC